LQEVDDLGQFALGVVDPGDVVEGDPDRVVVHPAGSRTALSQNEGTSVENSVVGVAAWPPGGYRRLVANVPWIVSPVEEIDLTWPASTWARK
jgi:hypothetical protein